MNPSVVPVGAKPVATSSSIQVNRPAHLPNNQTSGIAIAAVAASSSSSMPRPNLINPSISHPVTMMQQQKPESLKRPLPRDIPSPPASAMMMQPPNSRPNSIIPNQVPTSRASKTIENDLRAQSLSVASTLNKLSTSSSVHAPVTNTAASQSANKVIIPDEEMAFYLELERQELERQAALIKSKPAPSSTQLQTSHVPPGAIPTTTTTTSIASATQSQVEIISAEEMAMLEELEQQMMTQQSSTTAFNFNPTHYHHPVNPPALQRNISAPPAPQLQHGQSAKQQHPTSLTGPSTQPIHPRPMNSTPQVRIHNNYSHMPTAHSQPVPAHTRGLPLPQSRNPVHQHNAQLVGEVYPRLSHPLILI
jgi:hypothetical protein